MKLLITTLLLTLSLNAQSFSQRSIEGIWEISSVRSNGFINFGKDIGKDRREHWTLIFNREGRLKVVERDRIYNYEIVGGKLKIYETRIGYNGWVTKRKNQYDLMQISGRFEGCYVVKTTVKKITGMKKKEGFKMCKIEDAPKPTYQRGIEDYKF